MISRILRTLNGRYLCGRIPLLHTIVIFVQFITMARLMARFDHYYETRPLLTMMITNSILGGVADTCAQILTSIRERAVRKPGGATEKDVLARGIHELDEKHPLPKYKTDLIPPSYRLPPPFDFERLTRFMAWGFIMAPVQYKWFQLLSTTFPITKNSGTTQALKRVVADQLCFAPVGLGLFFSYLTLAEGGGPKAVKKKMEQVYVATLKANYMIWPLVQILNFRVIPLQFQLPFVSTIGIFWTCYISLANSATQA